MDPTYSLVIYNRQGDLWDRARGKEADLREQGAAITTLRGQLAWTCYLLRNGGRVAVCKRGVWTALPWTPQ